jgi:hypothetical protein
MDFYVSCLKDYTAEQEALKARTPKEKPLTKTKVVIVPNLLHRSTRMDDEVEAKKFEEWLLSLKGPIKGPVVSQLANCLVVDGFTLNMIQTRQIEIKAEMFERLKKEVHMPFGHWLFLEKAVCVLSEFCLSGSNTCFGRIQQTSQMTPSTTPSSTPSPTISPTPSPKSTTSLGTRVSSDENYGTKQAMVTHCLFSMHYLT